MSKQSKLSDEKNPVVFLDLAINSEFIGRVVIELFRNVVPKTADNFLTLCTGEKTSVFTGRTLTYKSSIFHRVIKQFMVQGGDIINHNGQGNESIYGKCFEDENFTISHDTEGVLSMANSGKDSNGSQFIITTVPCTHLDGINVVFGRVLKGLGVVKEINDVATDKNDRPLLKCEIIDCGELTNSDDWHYCDYYGANNETSLPPFPEDCEFDFEFQTMDELEAILTKVKEYGNEFYIKGDLRKSERAYNTVLRYTTYVLENKVTFGDPVEDNLRFESLSEQIILNLAATHLSKEDYRETIRLCDRVILSKSTSNCGKAYLRKGIALRYLNDLKAALECLQKALVLTPNYERIVNEIYVTRKIMKNCLVKEKSICAKMFQKSISKQESQEQSGIIIWTWW